MTDFTIVGVKEQVKGFEFFTKDVQRKVDLAAKTGKGRALDYLMFGREKRVNVNNITATSVVGITARTLGVPAYHIFYRTFTRGINRNKPYATGMVRTNDLKLIDLLVSAADAKEYYGYLTRKRGTKGSANKANKRNIGNTHALKARAKLKGKKSIRVGRKVFQDVFIESGKTRTSSKKMNRYYEDVLGAHKFNLTKVGNPYYAFTKRDKDQSKPYPVQVVKIAQQRVNTVANAAITRVTNTQSGEIARIQNDAVFEKLKKLGFKKL